MHYYSHHIGDFIKDTARLNDSQCMAYLRLIWMYYEHERPIENDIDAIAFKIGANASDVHQILKHFFYLSDDDGLWHQTRCDAEIAALYERSHKARLSAEKRWGKKNRAGKKCDGNANAPENNASAIRTNTKPMLPINPLTQDTNLSDDKFNTHSPESDFSGDAQAKPTTDQPVVKKTRSQKPVDLDYSCWPDQPSEQTMSDWLATRKRLKAPVSQTVINQFGRELALAIRAGYSVDYCLAECVTRGWRGFKAEWMKNANTQQQRASPVSAAERRADVMDYVYGEGKYAQKPNVINEGNVYEHTESQPVIGQQR